MSCIDDGTRQSRDSLQAHLKIGFRIRGQVRYASQISERGIKPLPLGKPDTDARFNQADQIISPKPVHMTTTLEEPAIYAIAETVSIWDRDIQPPRGLEYPSDLVEGGVQFQNMFERMVADDEVNGCRCDRESLTPADNLHAVSRRPLESGLVLIDRDDGTFESCRGKAPACRGQVEDALVLPQLTKPVVHSTPSLSKYSSGSLVP